MASYLKDKKFVMGVVAGASVGIALAVTYRHFCAEAEDAESSLEEPKKAKEAEPSPEEPKKEKEVKTAHDKHLEHLLRSAKKKFDKFDKDHNGKIEGDEVEEIVHWLWESFHVNGETLSVEDQAKKAAKLFAAVDKDHDGSISYEEFEVLFLKAAARIGAFHKKKNAERKKAAAAGKTPPPLPPRPKPLTKAEKAHKKHLVHMLRSARNKFDKFDTDGNGKIEGDEVENIVHWLWESFHMHGEKLTVEDQAKKTASVLQAVDTDHNGSINYEEFEKLFLKAAARIAAYHKKENATQKAAMAKAAAFVTFTPLTKEEKAHKKHLVHMLRSARKKFDKFDTDHNGKIEGDEINSIVNWLWESFHFNGEKLSDLEKANKTAQVLAAVDADHNGSINYEEFEKLFLKAAKRIGDFRKRANALAKEQAASAKSAAPVAPAPVVSEPKMTKEETKTHVKEMKQLIKSAHKKFKKLDEDKSGTLEGAEVEALAIWLWKSFHVKGETPMSAEDQAKKTANLLQAVDKDHNGSISYEEFEVLFLKAMPRITKFHAKV